MAFAAERSGADELRRLPANWQALLGRYRLRARQKNRPALVGGHLTRRKGQSLEFREFAAYTPGDDIRHVDWRATARMGQMDQWLVRRFQSEEQMTLNISVDLRPTMALPEVCSKHQVAAWLAEAVARIALAEGDRVVLHGLFGRRGPLEPLRGGGSSAVTGAVRRLFAHETVAEPGLNGIQQLLKPASVWLIISDFYGEDSAHAALAERILAARRGLCWVILVDLDTWPYERSQLGQGAREIEGAIPHDYASPQRYQINQEALTHVEQKIRRHKQSLLTWCKGVSLDRVVWSWPATAMPPAEIFFREKFIDDPVLARLFMREAG